MQEQTNLIIQYTIVGLLLLAVSVWIVWKLIRMRKQKNVGGCCGCSLSDTCLKNKKPINQSRK